MNILEMDGLFIADHIDELITLEDYVPVSFVQYDKHHERSDFLRSKNLLTTLQTMNLFICNIYDYHEDPVKAMNSVLIEWLNCHPEFEDIIAAESFTDYQNMKNNNYFIDFNDLLDTVVIAPQEAVNAQFNYNHDKISVKDDSNIKFPNFSKMKECYDKYPNTLLANYLAYRV